MKTYTVNTLILKEYLKSNGADSRAQLSIDARVSTHLIDKVIKGKAPNRQCRYLLSLATGIDEGELFPEIEAEEAA